MFIFFVSLLTFTLQVVFTDLSRDDVNGSEGRVWLVCNVVGDGNYQALASEFQINKSFSRTDVSIKNGLSFRKPLGVAATEITDYFNQTNKNIDGGDKEFMIPFLPSGSDAETLESTFRKLTNKKREQVSPCGRQTDHRQEDWLPRAHTSQRCEE